MPWLSGKVGPVLRLQRLKIKMKLVKFPDPILFIQLIINPLLHGNGKAVFKL